MTKAVARLIQWFSRGSYTSRARIAIASTRRGWRTRDLRPWRIRSRCPSTVSAWSAAVSRFWSTL